jgi:chromosome segregation ATPase
VIKQQTTISHLDAELDVQTKKNEELTKENGQLKSANSELEAAKNKTQGLLDRANKRIAELEQTVKDQQGDIENLIKEKDDAQSKVSAAQKARAKAEADLGELKKKAYDAGIDF